MAKWQFIAKQSPPKEDLMGSLLSNQTFKKLSIGIPPLLLHLKYIIKFMS